MATTEPSRTKATRRKRRWGDGPAETPGGPDEGATSSKRKSRFSSAPPPTAPASVGVEAAPASVPVPVADPKARAAALQASIAQRLAALKARTGAGGVGGGVSAPSTRPAEPPLAPTNVQKQKKRSFARTHENEGKAAAATKKAKVFELDMTATAPTRLVEKQQREEQLRSSAQPKEKVNPYLAHTVVDPVQTSAKSEKTAGGDEAHNLLVDDELLLDTRLAATHKPRLQSRPIKFVTPGTYTALGEKKRQQAALAEESGFLSGRKVGNVVKSVGMAGPASIEDGTSGDGSQDYGASLAGKVVEQRLKARIDAPEMELEDYVPKKKILTSLADVDLEKNDTAVCAAMTAATSAMPYAMEWWDAELLPSKLRKELAGEEGRAIASRAQKRHGASDRDGASAGNGAVSVTRQFETQREAHNQLIHKCYQHASLVQSRTHTLLQHPVPVLTPAQKASALARASKPSTLHLTKAERKRHRKLRRAERLREQQDLQAVGLAAPPPPRLTLSNYMKVLGDQAILDPSKMEATVQEQIHARKMKHEAMNAERKLTKEQRSAKHARKLEEDTSGGVSVALFWVRDMGHPYHRAKVDLNAQQNGITGGVLECEEGPVDCGMNLVVAEGGPRAIKRYTRLMTVRMRWKGEDFYEEDSDEEMMVGDEGNADPNDDSGAGNQKEKRKKFNPRNECNLIWTGMAVKRAFHSFMFQSAPSSVAARKILEAKSVAHYWDLCAGHVEQKVGAVGESCVEPGTAGNGRLRLRLGASGNEDREEDMEN